MMVLSRSSHRGVALLTVLATLVVLMTAATMLASAASSNRLQRKLEACTAIADGLVVSAEAPILHWLATKSGKVVLPPDSATPAVAVLHDRWTMAGVNCELVITAWDQLGMVPRELVREGSVLRSAIPIAILGQFDACDQFEVLSGLDQFMTDCDKTDPLCMSSFPKRKAHDLHPVMFGELRSADADSFHNDHPSQSSDAPEALGAFIAMHGSANARGAQVNVNTAPIPLLEAILNALGRGGIQQIIDARAQGKPAAIAGGTGATTAAEPALPRLVSTSTVWSFRIDARVGPVKKSWWAVYQPATTASRNRDQRLSRRGAESIQPWERLQRVVISF